MQRDGVRQVLDLLGEAVQTDHYRLPTICEAGGMAPLAVRYRELDPQGWPTDPAVLAGSVSNPARCSTARLEAGCDPPTRASRSRTHRRRPQNNGAVDRLNGTVLVE